MIHISKYFILFCSNWDVNHWNGPEGQQTNLGKTPIFVRDVIYVISHGPEFGTSWNLHVLQDFNSLICWSDVNIWPVWPVWNQRITNEWSQLGQGSPTKTGMADQLPVIPLWNKTAKTTVQPSNGHNNDITGPTKHERSLKQPSSVQSARNTHIEFLLGHANNTCFLHKVRID